MNRAELESLDRASLVDLALRQAERIAELEARLAEMDRRFAEMERRFEELERRAARGAAPFARPEGKRSGSPKRPGRKGGHEGSFRVRPPDEAVDSRIEVPLTHCPRCGGALSPQTDEALEQTLIEAPPARPQVVRLVTHRNRCGCCGEKVVSTHPLQVSTASGAAGAHLGPRALALAASLNKGQGLTMRTTCQVLRDLLGIELSPGGLSQALGRVAARVEPLYDGLLAALKAEPVLHTDETSWWVGGRGASLWVLTNQAGTVYRVVASKSRSQAEALIGDYQGVLVSDCLNIYDELTPVQQKCYAHHLKQIGKGLEDPRARGSAYLKALRALLVGAMALKAARADLPTDLAARMRQALETNADALLGSPRTAANADPDAAPLEEKLRQRLSKQRDHLFTFLDHEATPATNNLAERQLRPAVISRKLSCGNKTERGAATWQVLASLAATCRQSGRPFPDFLTPRLAIKPSPA
jgi:transposase